MRLLARCLTPPLHGPFPAALPLLLQVGIYLPLYDHLLQQCQATPALAGAGAPLLAGTLARTAAVYCTAPFELVRTRLQAAHAHAPAAATVAAAGGGRAGRAALLLQHVPSAAASNGSRLAAAGKLWTGVGATLARDVPFSALYWGMVEPIRAALLPGSSQQRTEWQVFTANVTGARAVPAGCSALRAGVCAAAVAAADPLAFTSFFSRRPSSVAPFMLPRSRRAGGRAGGRHHHPL